MYVAMKISNICWSIQENDTYSTTEQFTDLLIARGENDRLYFVLRQYVHLFAENTEQKPAICCGYPQCFLPDDTDTSI